LNLRPLGRKPTNRINFPEANRVAFGSGNHRVLLDRDFTAAALNQRWVGDTIEFVIGDGGAKLYLAAVLDLFSRFVVGWAISAVNDRRLTLKALEMAVARRCPDPGLLHHSDRGCTYTCADYRTYLAG
jgi:putative transposase